MRAMGLGRLALLPMLALLSALRAEAGLDASAAVAGLPTQPQDIHNKAPGKCMYELAMERAMAQVKSGRRPEPGSLLDLLPKGEEASQGRRRLDASWRLLGVNVGLTQSLSLAALNASFFRFDSVQPPDSVDWRSSYLGVITPVQVQGNCESCWAMAALDSVAIMQAIATGNSPVALSTQQVCDCTSGSCCQGGWPEDAFAYAVANGNVTDSASYPYRAVDNDVCAWTPSLNPAAAITGWERVPAYNSYALMKAVSMQPILAFISASASDFQLYTSGAPGSSNFTIYNGNCNSDVNHAVLVVGYSYSGGYWIVKNTWFTTWGHNGYMYIAMQDGEGKCGMLSLPPLFPVNFPTAPVQVKVSVGGGKKWLSDVGDGQWWKYFSASSSDPCSNVINPCGAGWCYNNGGIAGCWCPSGYTEVVLVPTSKCIPLDVCNNALVNPCGAGSCTNVGDGSYVCLCNAGYLLGSRTDGAPTCIPAGSYAYTTYIASYGDSCASVISAFSMTSASFAALNPLVNCSSSLIPGAVVAVNSSTTVGCTNQYAVRQGDTCDLIASAMQSKYFYSSLASATSLTSLSYTWKFSTGTVSRAALLALNPALDCTSLFLSQPICINGTTNAAALAGPNKAYLTCGTAYTANSGDSCGSVMSAYKLNSTYFAQLNPGLNCNTNGGSLTKGFQICVAPGSVSNSVGCTAWYTVKQGDSCSLIWNAANLTQPQFLALNPGIRCQTPYLVMGEQVCINSSTITSLADPGFYTYATQPGDTVQSIQAQYATKCLSWSISADRIAAYNNIANWTNSTYFYPKKSINITIPCVIRIGASCGCSPSLTVCGTDGVPYPSYCDAVCNFATPATTGTCSTCRTACASRPGLASSSPTTCPGTCPYPAWAPPYTDACQQYSTSLYNCPQCEYSKTACVQGCNDQMTTLGLTPGTQAYTDSYNQCYAECFGCQRVPCNGPGANVTTINMGWTCQLCGSSSSLNTTMCSSAITAIRNGYTCLAKCSFFYFANPKGTHY